ncbi:MAG TPA: putative nucleotidyltransferase substrate binding domain-containing protein [Solirubrobacteraceae bacterium]|jgi:CBS domain-containing protein|nr:putative nucleotidyltransferase substrate binding domain-containing protein [Solirubrobacteraceae bacterium]
MEHLDTFLSRQPPFDALAPADVAAIAAHASEVAFDEGELVLVEDGAPADGLYVICAGSIELVHEGEPMVVLEPGECFGHPSLLSGMAPVFTVRAREPSLCALLSAEDSRRVLATAAGTSYVARTMRTRLTRTGHTVHGLLDVGTTPVSAIMRAAVFCEPGETLRAAAQRLGEGETAALLVRLGESELGILADADVRAWVARGEPVDDVPVRAIARTPIPSVPVGQLAVEATIDMLAVGAEQVAVLDGERVCGVLSVADLVGLDARSPIALRHTILGAADEDGLVRAARHLPQLFRLLLSAGVPSRDIGRVLSLQHDALTARLLDFSLSKNGPAPVTWAWLDFGSAARREFTLSSDQDNALAYETPPVGEAQDVDAYFARLGREVNAGLARCGFGVDNNEVLAGNRLWRMSKTDWIRTFDECLRVPNESHLIRASVAFDFRQCAGGLAITAALTERIRAAREHPDFMRLMARTATGYPVALGFRGNLAVERHGEGVGRLDLKRGAIVPLVNVVRFHALASGVTISPTLDRIEAVTSAGGIGRGAADALREAFGVVARLRFEHHAQLIAAGLAPDNLIDPQALAPIARAELREALHAVRREQKRLGVWVPPGL